MAKAKTQSEDVITTERTFTLERETKGAIRYAENSVKGQANLLGTLYLRKDAMVATGMCDAGEWPKTLDVVILSS